MTITERERIDKRFKKASKVGKWVRKHINEKLGDIIVDCVRDLWSKSYDR